MMLYTAPKVRTYREDACEFWLGSFQYVSFTGVSRSGPNLMVPWRVQGGGANATQISPPSSPNHQQGNHKNANHQQIHLVSLRIYLFQTLSNE
jgi:hypothetical protein